MEWMNNKVSECEQLALKIGALLKEKHLTVSFVESCTGGLLASFITSVSGASSYFNQSWITYSNQAKRDLVDVANETLNAYGAVSEQVAKEMSVGCLLKAKADLAVSVTGIAGPGGGTEQKPVGMVCFGLSCGIYQEINKPKNSGIRHEKDKKIVTMAHTQYFKGDRTGIRFQAVEYAFKILLREIEKIS